MSPVQYWQLLFRLFPLLPPKFPECTHRPISHENVKTAVWTPSETWFWNQLLHVNNSWCISVSQASWKSHCFIIFYSTMSQCSYIILTKLKRDLNSCLHWNKSSPVSLARKKKVWNGTVHSLIDTRMIHDKVCSCVHDYVWSTSRTIAGQFPEPRIGARLHNISQMNKKRPVVP